MTAVATSKTDGSASNGGQVKEVSIEDAQAILSSISAKIYGTSAAGSSTSSSTNTRGVGGGSNDGAGEVTGADLAKLRAVAFGSEEGKKVRFNFVRMQVMTFNTRCVETLGGCSKFGAQFILHCNMFGLLPPGWQIKTT